MAQRKINPDYLSYYNKVTMIQPLAHGYVLKQTLERVEGEVWRIYYSSTAPYPLCPFDGMSRACKDCEGNTDEDKCLGKRQTISTRAVCGRINDCIKAGLEVEYEE